MSNKERDCELPEGMMLPAKTLAQLLELEKLIQDGGNYHKLVSCSSLCRVQTD